MTAKNGFFQHPAHSSTKPYPVNVVGGSLFAAATVGLIDSALLGRLYEFELKVLLDSFFYHFPSYSVAHPSYKKPTEQMALLINKFNKADLVDCFTYVVRQITVDTMLASPLLYQEQLSSLDRAVTEDQLRTQDKPHSPNSLAALADALKIIIVLSYEEPGKELRAKKEFNGCDRESSSAVRLKIQVRDDGYCLPYILHKEHLNSIGQFVKRSLPPLALSRESNTLQEALNQVSKANEALWLSFIEHQKRLNGMLAHGEITEETLRNLYIRFLPDTEDVGLFKRLGRAHQSSTPWGNVGQNSSDLLISALARQLSKDKVKSDVVYTQLENNEAKQFSLPMQ